MNEATVTSKGHITIPKAVRARLNLQAGDKVLFVVRNDGNVLLRARTQPPESLYGLLKDKVRSKRLLTFAEMNPGNR